MKMSKLKKRTKLVVKLLTYTIPIEELVGAASGSQIAVEQEKEPVKIISKF